MNSVMHVDYTPKDGNYICEHVILHKPKHVSSCWCTRNTKNLVSRLFVSVSLYKYKDSNNYKKCTQVRVPIVTSFASDLGVDPLHSLIINHRWAFHIQYHRVKNTNNRPKVISIFVLGGMSKIKLLYSI